ncbi:hypothetical protein BH09VER1_BH09VER1_48570 [soil metagenome]
MAGTSRADVVKAQNNTALNLDGSYVGGVAPTSSDVILYNNTVTGNNISVLGGDLSIAGITVTDPGTGSSLMRIDPTTGATLTLGSSGIDMSAASASLQIGANAELGADQIWDVAAGYTLTQSGTLSGSGVLTIQGTGTYNTSGNANTYSGGTILGDGIHVAINASGATTTQFGTGDLTIGNNVQIFGPTGTRFVNNHIVLNGDLTVGSTAYATTNTQITNGITVASGTHAITIINGTDPTSSVPGLNINPNGVMDGAGTLALVNGNAANSPEVWVRWGTSGTFGMTADLSIGSGVQVFFNRANLLTASTDLTIESGGTLDLSNKGGAVESQTVQTLSGAGIVTTNKNSGGISILTIDGGTGTASSTFSGNIISGTTAGASIQITKLGTTTQIFSGSNNYIGQTQVNAGTLLLNGSHTDSSAVSNNGYGSATNGHFYTASGATFGGAGYIAGNNAQTNSNMVYVDSGGALAPGAAAGGIGTLTLDGADISGSGSHVLGLASGATFSFDLAGDGGTPDRVDFWNYASGDVLLNSNVINLTLNGAAVAGTYTVSLFRFYSDNGLTGMNSGLVSGLTIGTVDPNISGTPTLNFNAGGSTIDLTYTVVPEPSTVLLCGLGLGLVLWRGRRRLKA